MQFLAIFKIAFDALWANKLRSGLTLLGVVFGVTSVMTIISALEGVMDSVAEDINRLGPSTFMVSRMMIAMSEEEFLEKIKRKPIELDAVKAIEDACENCDKLSPRSFSEARVQYRDKALRNVTIIGGTSSFVDIVDYEVDVGRVHSSEDDLYRRRVALIGGDLKEELFPNVDALGKEIKIGDTKYTVIGVAKPQGSSFGQGRDNYAIVPLSAYSIQFGRRDRGLNVLIKASSVEALPDAMDEVRMILRAHRGVPYNKPDDFDMLTADSFLDLFNQITKFFRFALIGVGSISLVVGGIVVMNIMIVAVSERTREIGIRKAIGARRSQIMSQFLFESLIVTMSGGTMGILFGFLIARSLVQFINMNIDPSLTAILSGLIISSGVGIISGLYPALRAARLDPIKALSYE
jgi:putative ABC transport system permease protein